MGYWMVFYGNVCLIIWTIETFGFTIVYGLWHCVPSIQTRPIQDHFVFMGSLLDSFMENFEICRLPLDKLRFEGIPCLATYSYVYNCMSYICIDVYIYICICITWIDSANPFFVWLSSHNTCIYGTCGHYVAKLVGSYPQRSPMRAVLYHCFSYSRCWYHLCIGILYIIYIVYTSTYIMLICTIRMKY